ncbi:hypothetical protein DFJ73DRAFT_112403 [Zopfochytrium polystomum]|nr:hypothetical protein DFJ73DRAFT_112403 [Zopfochytrium polystomum]
MKILRTARFTFSALTKSWRMYFHRISSGRYEYFKFTLVVPKQSEASRQDSGVDLEPPALSHPVAVSSARAVNPPDTATSKESADAYDLNVPSRKELWTDLIPDNWKCKVNLQKHPIFISYRQACDGAVANELFFGIKLALLEDYISRGVTKDSFQDFQHAFLDVKCLSHGQPWGVNFMSGLFHSGVVLLLCSDKAMERMQTADQTPDNVLLEVS